jgi:hypothetical protein
MTCVNLLLLPHSSYLQGTQNSLHLLFNIKTALGPPGAAK